MSGTTTPAWSKVADNTTRMKVPGGWLYYRFTPGHGSPVMVFVPDRSPLEVS